jgi:hypothetical protein
MRQCRRGLSSIAEPSILQDINQALFQMAACQGIMPVGPSVDGDLVPTLAPNGFRKLNGKQQSIAAGVNEFN